MTGGTGSGKSTLVNLIPRFFDPSAGVVLLDGRPLQDYPLKVLRNRVGIVPQRASLFRGTIRSNLLFGNEKASEEDLWRALEIAQAADFVREKEDGLDAPGAAGRQEPFRRSASAPHHCQGFGQAPANSNPGRQRLGPRLCHRGGAAPKPCAKTALAPRSSWCPNRVASIQNADAILVLEDGPHGRLC